MSKCLTQSRSKIGGLKVSILNKIKVKSQRIAKATTNKNELRRYLFTDLWLNLLKNLGPNILLYYYYLLKERFSNLFLQSAKLAQYVYITIYNFWIENQLHMVIHIRCHLQSEHFGWSREQNSWSKLAWRFWRLLEPWTIPVLKQAVRLVNL